MTVSDPHAAERPDEGPAAAGPPSEQRRGTALDALRQPTFRRVFTGAFLSNIGTWMQNIVLGALVFRLTDSATFVSIVGFAQFGPMLLFSLVGGLIADSLDRRRLLIAISTSQALLALVLALVTRSDDPSRYAIVGVVFLIGLGQSVFGPAYSALLPDLVGPGNLAGAISLNSTQMNGSRVIGPAIGGLVFAQVGASWVFVINAATYLFVIRALYTVTLPVVVVHGADEKRLQRLALGFRVARARHPVGRSLSIMLLLSLFSLPFIGQMPVLAERNLGIQSDSSAYGWLYACFGLGAMCGALSIGTVLARRSMEGLTRVGLAAFAVSLATFGLLRSPAPAYLVIAVLGFFYFGTVTSLSTVMQGHLATSERGRVMALWMMAFGGMVPVGNLIAGPIIDATSVTAVVLPGAAVALFLAWWADLHPRPTDR